ncbi:hypothetical protein [Vibrio metschnikovii]|nr:hypothetical protein [Vibrio metschnikovii]MBC5832853.1 hypothetical protein [Vibrio metschnikovii]
MTTNIKSTILQFNSAQSPASDVTFIGNFGIKAGRSRLPSEKNQHLLAQH